MIKAMENDGKYEEIINRMRESRPTLENPTGFTSAVMGKIESWRGRRVRYRLLQITGIFSGIAASLLICLFVELATQLPDSDLNDNTLGGNQSLKIERVAILGNVAGMDENVRFYSVSEKVGIAASIAGKRKSEMEKRRKLFENQIAKYEKIKK